MPESFIVPLSQKKGYSVLLLQTQTWLFLNFKVTMLLGSKIRLKSQRLLKNNFSAQYKQVF